mgnify:CR=1 FL=1
MNALLESDGITVEELEKLQELSIRNVRNWKADNHKHSR